MKECDFDSYSEYDHHYHYVSYNVRYAVLLAVPIEHFHFVYSKNARCFQPFTIQP